VIRFGDMPTSKALRRWLASIAGLRQLVIDPAFGWNEPSTSAEAIVRAEPRALAAGLAQRLAGGQEEWRAAWLEAGRAAAAAIQAELGTQQEPTEPGAHVALSHLYSDGDLVYTASSMPIRDQEAFLPSAATQVRFLCNRGANGIDGLVSSGIGAAAASGRPTWILTGDLGLYHDMNGLAALAETSAPVRVIVLNNDGGGIFEFLPQAEQIERPEFEALLGTPLGLDLARVAAVYDLPHARVERLDRLAGAVDQTALVELPVDRQRNVELHRRIADRVGEALAALHGA
jgi:2-succinyl-5-enolpyruvyl-6-hydroxy-3-cyclohexene-1-carboxylate synthase